MPRMPVTVRAADLADAGALAEVNVRGWQVAYANIVPADFLATLRLEPSAERFAARLGDDPPPGTVPTLVAEHASGAVIGYVSFGPYRDDDVPASGPGWGEVYALYVHPEHWGRGVGHSLMSAALDRLGDRAPVALWVLTENAAARAFYERQGFRPDGGAHVFQIAGAALPELRYVRAPVG